MKMLLLSLCFTTAVYAQSDAALKQARSVSNDWSVTDAEWSREVQQCEKQKWTGRVDEHHDSPTITKLHLRAIPDDIRDCGAMQRWIHTRALCIDQAKAGNVDATLHCNTIMGGHL